MLWTIFLHVNKWVAHNRPDEDIALFFESGYKTQSKANQLLQLVSQDRMGGKNRVSSHTFMDKAKSMPTQAADLIVWQIRKGYENSKKDLPIRGDTLEIIRERKIFTIEYNRELLNDIKRQMIDKFGSLQAAALQLFASA